MPGARYTGGASSISGRWNLPRAAFEKSYSLFMASTFFVLPRFMSSWTPRGGDPDQSVISARLNPRVNHENEPPVQGVSQCYPSLLVAAMLMIENRCCERIAKHGHRQLERDAVLRAVRSLLLWVPVEINPECGHSTAFTPHKGSAPPSPRELLILQPMRDDAVDAEAPLLVFLVVGEVAFEPLHVTVAF